MKRQPYFPRIISQRPEWFRNYGTELPLANATLALPAPAVANSVADALFCEYACGPYLTAVREFGPAATASVEELLYGPGTSPHVLTVFTPPALGGVVPVDSGALERIAKFIQTIKASPNYTEAIGLQLGIVGAEDTVEQDRPTFEVKNERGGGSCECVKILFRKYGRDGVAVYSRRGGGDWELLGIDLASPYLDERPLLVPGTPEVRDYRLQFYDDSAPTGPYTDPKGTTVTP